MNDYDYFLKTKPTRRSDAVTMKTAEEIEHKLRIHIETTEECLENFNLDKTTIEILNQELELLKYVHEYFTSHPTHTLPSDEEIYQLGMNDNTIETDEELRGFEIGMKQMRFIASPCIAEMEREIKRLQFMIENGLGAKDIKNDI